MCKCVLCGAGANVRGTDALDTVLHYTCPICGEFNVTDKFVKLGDKANAYLLSGYIQEQNINGNTHILITTKNVEDILSSPLIPHTPKEKLDKLLLWYYKKTEYFGQEFEICLYPSICYAKNSEELNNYYIQCDNSFFSKYVSTLKISDKLQTISLTFNAHKYCYELLHNNSSISDNCFVAMWFNEVMQKVYNNAISSAISECGFKAVKVDNVEHNNDITDEIISGIKSSRFVIADMTGYRGGVYYEAGFAKGLGKQVILTCRKDWFDGEYDDQGRPKKERIHFDINHLNIIVWETEEELKTRLISRIKATIL